MKDRGETQARSFPTVSGRSGLELAAGRRSWCKQVNLFTAVAAALLLTASVPGAAARPNGIDDADTSNPGGAARAVRLSSVEGQVQVVQNGQVIADQATSNLPLFEGSQIIAGNDGQAEIQMEDGSLARLSPNSTLTLTVLQREGTGTRTEIVLNSGLAYFELQPNTAENSLRVSFDRTSFEASGFSVARVKEDTPPGQLAVFSGNLHVERGSTLQVDVHGGESLTLDATDLDKYNVAESIEPDSWDTWNADRDQQLNAASATRTSADSGAGINQGMGASELDANGNWYNVPGQGYIWSPYDAQGQGVGWDPYGFGRWVFYPRYGYVWVSGYNWGYAPFQCGNWNYFDTIGWGWAPGIGGCNPWWYGGGWGYNLGNYPRGYRPPRRPTPGPIRPPVRGGGLQRVASIPVDRRQPGALPGTNHVAGPVTIAGHTVEPLRPVAPRPAYGALSSSFAAGAQRTTQVPVIGRTYTFPAARPGQGGYQYSGGGHPAATRPTGGGMSSGASHPASSAASSGGGGHVSSGGGGGGGGGGTHK